MRAFTFRQAIDAGYEPREYNENVKEGTLIAVLDFKIWGKSNNLRCSFSTYKSGEKFSLSAYRMYRGKIYDGYLPEDLLVDFSEPGIEGNTFLLEIRRGKRGKLCWKRAEPLMEK